MVKNKKTFAALIVALLIVGGLYWWQAGKKEVPASKVDREVAREGAKVATVNCATLGDGWIKFTAEAVGLSFCYHTSWGPVEHYEEESKWKDNLNYVENVGETWYINFESNSAPLLSYKTLDYEKVGPGSDVVEGRYACGWNCVDINANENALKEAFGVKTELGDTLQRVIIGGKPALKLTYKENENSLTSASVSWTMSKVLKGNNYNLQITGYPSQAADLEKLVGSINF